MTVLAHTPAQTMGRTLRCGRGIGYLMGLNVAFFLLVIILVFVGLGIIQGVAGGWGPDGTWLSSWEHALQPFRYHPMAMGVLAFVLLPSYVANGVTRFEFSLACVLVILGTAIGLTAAGILGFGVEHVIYGWYGQDPVLTFPHLFASTGDVVPLVGEYLLLITVHMAVGWTIGLTYYRYGGWIGTILIPLAVLPAVAMEAMLVVSWIGELMADNWGLQRQPLPIVIPTGIALIVMTLYVNHLLGRKLALKS